MRTFRLCSPSRQASYQEQSYLPTSWSWEVVINNYQGTDGWWRRGTSSIILHTAIDPTRFKHPQHDPAALTLRCTYLLPHSSASFFALLSSRLLVRRSQCWESVASSVVLKESYLLPSGTPSSFSLLLAVSRLSTAPLAYLSPSPMLLWIPKEQSASLHPLTPA